MKGGATVGGGLKAARVAPRRPSRRSAALCAAPPRTFFESIVLHLSTARPQHSRRGSRGSGKRAGKAILRSSSCSLPLRASFLSVLTNSATSLSCASTPACNISSRHVTVGGHGVVYGGRGMRTCSISSCRCGPQQRTNSCSSRPKRSDTCGMCISARRHQKKVCPTRCGQRSARRSRKRARGESWRASYLSTCQIGRGRAKRAREDVGKARGAPRGWPGDGGMHVERGVEGRAPGRAARRTRRARHRPCPRGSLQRTHGSARRRISRRASRAPRRA